MSQKHFNLKNLLPKRPMPTIEMTRPYTSSVNVDTLLKKIRQWEIYADKVESNKEAFEKELREADKSLHDEKGFVSIYSVRELKRIREFLGDE